MYPVRHRRTFVALALLLGCSDDTLVRIQGRLEAPREVDFGPVSLGLETTRRVRVRNLGRAPARVQAPTVDGSASGAFRLADARPLVLTPGAEAELDIVFAPAAKGPAQALMRVATDVESALAFDVALKGLGVLGRADPDTLRIDFGRVAIRKGAQRSFDLINVEDTPAQVHLGPPEGSDGDFFRVSAGGWVEVPPQGRRTVNVAFRPARIGPHASALPVRPCPSCDLVSVELAGEGIDATLVAEPSDIDFGFVQQLQTAHHPLVLRNLGSLPVVIHDLVIDDSAAGFAVSGAVLPATLQKDESLLLDASFTAATLDARRAALHVLSDAAGSEDVVVGLQALGGGPRLQLAPNPLSFPRTALGMSARKEISVRNSGLDPDGKAPLEIRAWRLLDGAADFTVEAPAAPFALQAGRARTFFVHFHPSAKGPRAGTLRIESNDPLKPVVDVRLAGNGIRAGVCTYVVTPPRLDFGSVPVGGRARLAFAVRNTGPEACNFTNVRAGPTTPRAFEVLEQNSVVVPPGDQMLVSVEFRPDAEGPQRGTAEFDASSGAAPHAVVELAGLGAPGCLTLVPPVLDFGTTGLACAPPMRSVEILNNCSQTVTVAGAAVGPGPDSDSFVLASGAARTLAPGESTRLDVTYTPTHEGSDSAALLVATTLSPAPYVVSLQGAGARRPVQTDVYKQPPIPQVDFLFVVDNSGSFSWHQEALGSNFNEFIRHAIARGVDFRVAVTTTGLVPYSDGVNHCPGGVEGGEDGRFFPVDNSRPRILTPQTPDLRGVFMANVRVGTCHWHEDALEAARRALTPPVSDHADDPRHPEPNDGNIGFMRPDAELYVLYVTDSDDLSGVPVQVFVQHLRSLKPGRPDLVHASAIVGHPTCTQIDAVGTRVMQVVNAMNGVIGDVCDPGWAGILGRIGMDAFKPHDTFPLSQLPDGRSITVEVDDVPVPARAPDGSENWHYDPTLGPYGSIVFAPGRAPGPATTIEISYPVPCPLP